MSKLTDAEKKAAMSSTFYHPSLFTDEEPPYIRKSSMKAKRWAFEHGWPAVCVAAVRGAPLDPTYNEYHDAMEDVARWLRVSKEGYLTLINDQGPFMWDRVRNGTQ